MKEFTTQDLHQARSAHHPNYEVKMLQNDGVTTFVYIDADGEPFASWEMGVGVNRILVGAV